MASQQNLTNIAISTGFTTLLHTEDSDGVTSSFTDIYDGDGTRIPLAVSTTAVKIPDGSFDFDIASHDGTNGLKLGGTLVTASATEINYLDISSLGSAQASKVLTTDANLDISGIRNLTATGTIQALNFTATGDTAIGNSVANDTLAINSTITTNLVFEGSTDNEYETTLAITDPTADRTVTLPNATTLLVGQDTTDTLTNKTIDVDNNTLSNVELDNLKSGVLDTDLSSVSGSDDTVASAKAIKTYIDTQDSNIASDTLTFTNKTFDVEATGNSISNIDVANLKSGVLDTDISSVSGSDDTLASAKSIKTYVDSQDANIASDTLTFTNKTFDVEATGNSISNIDVADLKSGVLDTDISSVSSSDDTLASAKAIKAYIDAQDTASDLDFQGDSGGALSIDLDSETLDIAGGTGIDTSGSSNTLTVAIDSTVATLTGSQTLTNKTLTSPDINGGTADSLTSLTVANNVDIGNHTLTANGLTIDGTFTDGALSIASGSITNAVNGTFSGTVQAEQLTTTDDATISDQLSVDGTMTISTGSIVDSTGAIDFGNENLSTSGTLGAGAGTLTSLSVSDGNITNVGNIALDTISADDTSITFSSPVNFNSQATTNVNIDSGNIDGVTIATSNITVGSSKTLDVSAGTLTLADNQISGDKVEGGTIASTTISALTTAGITASANLDIGDFTIRANNFLADSQTATQVAFYGANGVLSGDSDMTFSGSTLSVTDLAVSGTLTTTGSVQEVSTTNLNVQDPLILLNKYDSQPTNNAFDAGFIIKRGSGDSAPANVGLIFDESANQFALIDTSEDGTTAGNVSITDYENLRVGALTADDASTFSSTISTASGSTIGNLTLANGSITDSSGAISFGNENLSTSGTLSAGAITGTSFIIGSADISEAELEILDGASVTTAELNIMDGDTSATSTTVADADRVVLNDAGTMKQVAVTDLSAYFDDEITAMPNLVQTSTLNSGAISSGFGNIDIGSSNLTATGTISLGSTDLGGNNITDVGIIAVDQVQSASSSAGFVISMLDNVDPALSFKVGTTDYIKIDTTDGSELIEFHKPIEFGVNVGTMNFNSNNMTNVDIDSGAIDGTPIGANSANTGAFTTLTASGDVNFDSNTLFVDASANAVGIGTNSPQNDVSGLHVSVASSTDQLYLERTGSGTGRYYLGTSNNSFFIVDDAQTATRLTIDDSGKVGIKTDSPGGVLQIDSALGAPSDLGNYEEYHLVLRDSGGNTNDAVGMLFSSSADTFGGSAIVHYDTGAGGQGDLAFYTKQSTSAEPPVEVMRLDDSGNTEFSGAITAGDDITLANNKYYQVKDTAGSAIRLLGLDNSDNIYMGFVDDANGTGSLNLRTAGTNALTIDNSQNVGIDQTSPSSFYSGARNLVIGNTSQAESGLTIVSSGGASSYGEIFFADGTTGNEAYRGFIQYNHDNSTDSLLFGTAGSERMRITSGGDMYLGGTASGGTPALYFYNNDTARAFIQASSTSMKLDSDSGFEFHANNGASRIDINSSGQLGVNCTPGFMLNVDYGAPASADRYIGVFQSESTRQFAIGWDDDVSSMAIGTKTNHNLNIFTNGITNPRMTIASDGDVGIGTTANLGKLSVNSGISGSSLDNVITIHQATTGNDKPAVGFGVAIGNGGESTNAGDLIISTASGGSLGERMRITSDGHTLIGVTSITDTSSRTFGNAFSGSSSYGNWTSWGSGSHTHAIFRNGTSIVGTITTSSSATAYNTSSDYRLKENEVIISDGLTRLNELKPYRFNFISDADTTVDGFFAHEVAEVVPEAVTGEKDAVDDGGNIVSQGIDQSKLVPLLVKALQEADDKIDALTARIEALEA